MIAAKTANLGNIAYEMTLFATRAGGGADPAADQRAEELPRRLTVTEHPTESAPTSAGALIRPFLATDTDTGSVADGGDGRARDGASLRPFLLTAGRVASARRDRDRDPGGHHRARPLPPFAALGLRAARHRRAVRRNPQSVAEIAASAVAAPGRSYGCWSGDLSADGHLSVLPTELRRLHRRRDAAEGDPWSPRDRLNPDRPAAGRRCLSRSLSQAGSGWARPRPWPASRRSPR